MTCASPSKLALPDTRFYGRRGGRSLRPARRRLVAEVLPRLRLPVDAAADPAALFAAPTRGVWLEIGFGAGEHLAWQAAANPQVGFIGAEPYINGVAAMLARIDAQSLANVRILDDDVRPFLAALAPRSISRAFILFPDPWPKRRHQQRRIVNRQTLDFLAAALRPGAELRMASDDPDYVCAMLRHVLDHPAFAWTARRAADWRRRPADWPATRYEQKSTAPAGKIAFLRAIRLP